MKLAVFSAKPYDKTYMLAAQATRFGAGQPVQIDFHDFPLCLETVPLIHKVDAICIFVNDSANTEILKALRDRGVGAVLLRCAGYNNVDLSAAKDLGMFVANVPAYSPEAVAEFACTLVQTVNRHPHHAYNRVREGNFSLNGLLGRTLHGKTVGLIGTGRIGVCMAKIMKGFGCNLLAFDPYPAPAFEELGGRYCELDEMLPQCDIVSLHCPLSDKTYHIINPDSLAKMKRGAILVNTSRGGLVDTPAVVDALKARHLGGLGLDVYEGEGRIFYEDHSDDIIEDDTLMRLMTFPNVVVCGHQAFFTQEALQEIAECTMRNLGDFMENKDCRNSLIKDDRTVEPREPKPVRTV